MKLSAFLISAVVLSTALSSCQSKQPTASSQPSNLPQPAPTVLTPTVSPSTLPSPELSSPELSFEPFRQRLLKAAQERDVAFIRAIAAPDIMLTFARPNAPDPLNYFLKLDDPNTLFWPRLERILTLGCAPVAEPNQPWKCPNQTATPPKISQVSNLFTAVYALGEVNVQTQPQANSAVVEVVSNTELKFDQAEHERFSTEQKYAMETLDGWFPVVTPAGNRGYVSSRHAFRPVGYRAGFEPRNGEWQMTLFLAGD